MKYGDGIVDEIKDKCNIVDVIGKSVMLKKTGSNYKGVCPFHAEKTPSFVVSEDKQIFTCFGCGATGDVIEFVRRMNNYDFFEAIEKLANEYGIEIKSSGYDNEGKKNILYSINKEAATFFYKSFKMQGNLGYQYMKKRGISDETLKTFGIGFADSGWDTLFNYLQKKNIDIKSALDLGLISNSKGKYFDKYRSRVIFPIINTRRKVIGFGGREIDGSSPKYLNSPESVVFLKKNNLYAINIARQEISKKGYAILVEGYMDVISLYQHGIKNVTASLGTALTPNQASMIKRYTNNVILAYDSDDAGQAATLRGIDILYSAGLNVKTLALKGKKDPDEFIKAYGEEQFLKAIKDSVPGVEFKMNLLKTKFDISKSDEKIAYIKEASKILKKLRTPVEADAYIKKLVNETNISEWAIRIEVFGNNMEDKGIKPETVKTKDNEPAGSKDYLEMSLIKIMLENSSYILKLREYDKVFVNPRHYRIAQVMDSLYKEEEEIEIKELEDSIDSEDIAALQNIIKSIQLSGKEDIIFNDCIHKIERSKLLNRQKEILDILAMIEGQGDDSEIKKLMAEQQEIQKKLMEG